MSAVQARAIRAERPSPSPVSANVAEALEPSRAEMLARRLCVELQALTGKANSSVLLDILAKRLRVGLHDLESGVSWGAEMGWLERRVDAVALQDEGRRATLIPWPPREPPRAQRGLR